MRRHLATLLLAALALLGLQRVPCLLGAAGGGIGTSPGATTVAEVPPCHRPPEAPAERPSPCSACDDLHRDVAGALAASGVDAPPAVLPAFAATAATARSAPLSFDAGAPARAPDPLRTTGVLLL